MQNLNLHLSTFVCGLSYFLSVFYVVVAKVGEKLAVSKQTMHKFCMERSNLKKLIEAECKEQHQAEI
jgi:hypothetical protein